MGVLNPAGPKPIVEYVSRQKPPSNERMMEARNRLQHLVMSPARPPEFGPEGDPSPSAAREDGVGRNIDLTA